MSGPGPDPEGPEPTDAAEHRARDRAGVALSRLSILGDYPPDMDCDLVAAALALSRLDRPDLALAPYLDHCDNLAHQVGSFALVGAEPAEALRRVLVEGGGYSGDEISYDDMDNADLARVIDRRRGLPVALGILWISAARAQGWEAEGLDVPNHFLIRLFPEPGDRSDGVVLDPFHGGEELGRYEIEMLVQRMGGEISRHGKGPRRVSDRSVLLRLQNNIKIRRFQAEDPEGGLACLSAMRTLAPDLASLALEQANVLVRSGAVMRARGILDGYLGAGHGDEGERRDVTRFLQALRTTLN